MSTEYSSKLMNTKSYKLKAAILKHASKIKNLNMRSVAKQMLMMKRDLGLSREETIRKYRGAFHYLPVFCSSDLVHGSWWYVWGSLVSALIPLVPLLDFDLHFFSVPDDTILPLFANKQTYVYMFFSGLFSTLGSYAFVRAFEDPHVQSLFTWYHDEPNHLIYWVTLLLAIAMVAASGFFVKLSYPVDEKESMEEIEEAQTTYCLTTVQNLAGHDSSLCRHVETDLLASMWISYWLTWLWVLSSLYFLIFSNHNDRQNYLWWTSLLDSVLFLLGGAYYCAGSYPHMTKYGTGLGSKLATVSFRLPSDSSLKATQASTPQDGYGSYVPVNTKIIDL